MIFCDIQAEFLSEEMFIDVQEFQSDLLAEFSSEASFFNDLVNFFLQDSARCKFRGVDLITFPQIRDSFCNRFLFYLRNNGYKDGSVFDYSYELFNYFCSYYFGGITTLFKDRAPEWEGPRIYLTHRICKSSQLESLPDLITVYRGMSEIEYNNSSYGMSWSLDIIVAKRFAENGNQSGTKSIVIEAEVNKTDVLYFDPTDHEKEIVVKDGLITVGIKT